MAYLPSDNPASLVGWFRKGIGVTSSGGFASLWADQSGNGHDLVQNTATNQPAYDGTAILTFDGIDNFMKCVAFTFNQPAQGSMLIESVTYTNNEYMADGNTGDSFGWWMNSNPTLTLYCGASGPTGTLVPGTFNVISAVSNGVSSSMKVDSSGATTGNSGARNPAGFTVGCYGNGIQQFGNIAVKEIILRNVDDATIRANDHQYLIDLQNAVTPVADFSGTPLSGTNPLSVAFTDLSTNTPTSWLWEKNDGSGWANFAGTPTAQNPSESFTAGTWSVRLTATNAGGSNTNTKNNYITVLSGVVTLTGGKGDNKKGKKTIHLPFKPSGLVERPKKTEPKIEKRVDESRQIQAEVAKQLAKEFSASQQEVSQRDASEAISKAASKKLQKELDNQIETVISQRVAKRKKQDEDDLRFILMAAGSV